MKKIIIINGPNLNLIGEREPKVYGNSSMEDYLSEIRNNFPEIQIDYFQTRVLMGDSLQYQLGEIQNSLMEISVLYS